MSQTIGIFYATREGHTRKIAEHVAGQLRARQLTVELYELASLEQPPALGRFAALVLAASVHLGKHEKEMVAFVRAHRAELERVPAAFLSVSMSERGAEDAREPPEKRARFAADVKRVVDQFLEATGWHPAHVKPVAGALVYTKYNALVRWVMKRIARSEGASTDTTRDHEYTDWEELDRFAAELADEIAASTQPPAQPTA